MIERNHLRIHGAQVRVTFLIKAGKSHADNDAGQEQSQTPADAHPVSILRDFFVYFALD
jgi:hypothetical protein